FVVRALPSPSTAPLSHSPQHLAYLLLSGPLPLTLSAAAAIFTLSLHDALPILGKSRIDRVILWGGEFPPDLDLAAPQYQIGGELDRKSTRLNSSHLGISYAVFCLKKKKNQQPRERACPQG